MHAVCLYPVKSTWIKATRTGNDIVWPLLSTENVHKHYLETDETAKGHLKQARKNVHSTKPTAYLPPTTDNTTLIGKRERGLYYKFYEAKHKTCSDHTSRFPFNSQWG